jgi:hypothetical protein
VTDVGGFLGLVDLIYRNAMMIRMLTPMKTSVIYNNNNKTNVIVPNNRDREDAQRKLADCGNQEDVQYTFLQL